MKNMVLLIDSNVILDYLLRREHFQSAKSIMNLCGNPEVSGYVAFHTIATIWYLLRKKTDHERRDWLLQICRVLTVTTASHKEVIKAIQQDDFHDFEDCLQDRCAVSVHADYIITRNVRDYQNAEVPAILPEDFLAL